MYRMSRSVITLVALLTLLALPLAASARGLDRPHSTASGEGGWLADVADWFQDFLSLHGRQGRHHTASSPSGFQTKEDENSTNGAAGGSCIDPQGRPKPWCL
jgi:hypothetical protein